MAHDKELELEALRTLNKFCKDNKISGTISDQVDLFSNECEVGVNWNSPPQVLKIFQGQGIPTEYKKKQTVSAKLMERHKRDFELVRRYLYYKQRAKDCSTYGNKFLNAVRADGRIHTSFKQLVSTGRMSCGRKAREKGQLDLPNLQNIPKVDGKHVKAVEARYCFVPEPGNVFIVADYASQESRILADKTKDKGLLDFYLTGGADLHSYTAQKIWPQLLNELTLGEVKDKFPELRDTAKKCYPPDTEVLTRRGWVKIIDIECTDEVIQVSPKDGMICDLSWVNPQDKVIIPNKTGKLIHYKNEGVDIRVTEDHKMVSFSSAPGRRMRVGEAATHRMKSRLIANAGIAAGEVDVDEQLIRLAVAVQADGSLYKQVGGTVIRFGFTKERKITRLRELLGDIPHKEVMRPINGKIGTFFTLFKDEASCILRLLEDKKFRWDTLLWNRRSREIFLEELKYWDSHQGVRNRAYYYRNTDFQSIDVAQAVAAITNKKSSIQYEGRMRKLGVMEHRYTRMEETHVSKIDYSGPVVCLTVPEGFLLVRDSGKVMVSGNCNFAIAYGGNGHTIADNADIPVDEGEQIYEAYLKAFPGVADFFEVNLTRTLTDGYITINEKVGARTFPRHNPFSQDEDDDIQEEDESVYTNSQPAVEFYKKLAHEVEAEGFQKRMKRKGLPKEEREEMFQKFREYNRLKSKLTRLSTNYLIQGTAALQTKLAGILFYIYLYERNLLGTVKIVNIIHDEYVVECPKEMAEEIKVALVDCMVKGGDYFMDIIPMAADAHIDTKWSK